MSGENPPDAGTGFLLLKRGSGSRRSRSLYHYGVVAVIREDYFTMVILLTWTSLP